MEHDRQTGLAGRGPHGVEADVAGRVRRRAARGDEQRRRAHRDRLGGEGAGAIEIGQGHVQAGQQSRVGGAELDHRPVVGACSTDGQLEIAGMLPSAQPGVVEGVEDQLAGEAEQIERPATILRDERSGGGEVLAGHDLGRLVGEVVGRSMPGCQSVERGIEIAQLLGRVAGLAELVDAGVVQRRDPLADACVGVVAQPVRRLHDMGVGVVHDQPG